MAAIRRWGVATILALACAGLVAACGSSRGSGGPSNGAGSGAGLRFAACMRSHGVPHFPDPGPSGGFPRGGGGPQPPAARAATKTCMPILRGGETAPAPTSSEWAAKLRLARCMRGHGVPNFPDPVTRAQVPHNANVLIMGGSLMFPVGPRLNVDSPAFRQAMTACGEGPPGGQPKGG
jgi:hypothetical protein